MIRNIPFVISDTAIKKIRFTVLFDYVNLAVFIVMEVTHDTLRVKLE